VPAAGLCVHCQVLEVRHPWKEKWADGNTATRDSCPGTGSCHTDTTSFQGGAKWPCSNHLPVHVQISWVQPKSLQYKVIDELRTVRVKSRTGLLLFFPLWQYGGLNSGPDAC
jgi:hypothetical protein